MALLTTEQRVFVVAQLTLTPNVTVRGGKQFRIRFPEPNKISRNSPCVITCVIRQRFANNDIIFAGSVSFGTSCSFDELIFYLVNNFITVI